jgi:ubiquinone/menaquinone biosynthesis C-methylase UbiE
MLSALTQKHLKSTQDFYDHHCHECNWASRGYHRILAHYFQHLIPAEASILEIGCGNGELLSHLPNRDVTGIDLSAKQIALAQQKVPHGAFAVCAGEQLCIDRTFDYIIISDTINEAADVQHLLMMARTCAHRETRLVLNFFSSLWRPIIALANNVGLRVQRPATSWFTVDDVRNLMRLSQWEIVKIEDRILCPIQIPWITHLLNAYVAHPLSFLNLSHFCVARPGGMAPKVNHPSVSIIVPARNEAGNIEAVITRTPEMGSFTEFIFVEGHSSDETWAEILRVQAKYPQKLIRAIQQTGKGKGNAVREGFAIATGDMFMILDTDLTMPPEELPKYFRILQGGRADFANGVRLVYPMEDEAMRFLNMCANKFFSVTFSWLLAQPVKDTLCGTKVLWRDDYEKIAANRAYFGDFDPFGDFDLLFGATRLNLKISDIPIRYQNRTYGSTNIQRFRHGLILFRMVFHALRKLKMI